MYAYFIGSEEDVEEAEKHLSMKLVEGTFFRPLNIKDLVEKLNTIVEEADSPARRKHILVVDDDGTMLRTLKLWLSDKYVVHMANSGVNAIALLAKKNVDLILLDYEMPIADGPQVLRMLKNDSETGHIPVMFLTGHGDKESVMSVVGLKPVDYLLKTIDKESLLKKLEEFFKK